MKKIVVYLILVSLCSIAKAAPVDHQFPEWSLKGVKLGDDLKSITKVNKFIREGDSGNGVSFRRYYDNSKAVKAYLSFTVAGVVNSSGKWLPDDKINRISYNEKFRDVDCTKLRPLIEKKYGKVGKNKTYGGTAFQLMLGKWKTDRAEIECHTVREGFPEQFSNLRITLMATGYERKLDKFNNEMLSLVAEKKAKTTKVDLEL